MILHNDTKITVSLEDLRSIWTDASDRTRLEILKSIIWTAPDMHRFYEKSMKILNSDSFRDSLD